MKYPLFVKWAITDECNLRCKHCYRKQNIQCITKEQANLVIQDLAMNNVACVALTGGEPLMSSIFLYIIQELKKYKIYTEIATNGVLLNEENVKQLLENGINKVQISLEGIDEKTNDEIRGRGTFKSIIENIGLLKKYNFCITVAVTLTQKNYKFIDIFYDIKKKMKIDFLRFELFIPVNVDKYQLSFKESDIIFLKDKKNEYLFDTSVIFPTFDNYSFCGAGRYMVMINSDLTLSPCDLLCDELRSSLKIDKNNSIKKIWNNDIILKKWRNIKEKGCIASILKYQTTEDIFENIYY